MWERRKKEIVKETAKKWKQVKEEEEQGKVG